MPLNGFDVDTTNGIRNLELRIGDLPALGLDACGERLTLAPERLELDDFAVLACYDAEPTPLPADRQRILELLDAFHGELRARLG